MAIVVGWFVAGPAGRTNYLPAVLVNVGTTLLLVGIVVLLERRIVDNAVRRFGNAAEEARARMRDDFRIEVQDFTDRVNAEWAAASPEDVDAMKERTKRLSKELADNYSVARNARGARRGPDAGAVRGRELGQVLAEPLDRDRIDPNTSSAVDASRLETARMAQMPLKHTR